jgi:SulP family sulfate permease
MKAISLLLFAPYSNSGALAFAPSSRLVRQKVSSPQLSVSSPIKLRYNHGFSFGANLQMGSTSSSDTSNISSNDPSPVQDALAGLTVAFSLLSKAIACSAIVGVNPLVGIWSSVAMGVTAPIIGAQAGVISGTAAVVTVPLAALTKSHGVEYMALCILVSALMEGLFGIFRLAKTAQLVSEQVLSGFLNGLGFILLLSQASVFRSAAKAGALKPTVAIAALCFSIVQGLPLITKAIPSSLVGLVVASMVGSALKLPLATLESGVEAGTFAGGFSSLPSLVNLSDLWSQMTSIPALKIVLPAAISIVIISLVETLLAGKVVEELKGQQLCPYPYEPENAESDEYEGCIPTSYDVPTRSVIALSAGNILSALFGGMGGCGLIPQTVLNIKSGGGGRLASASYAAAMASFVLFFAPLVGKISEAALAGIMITVAYDTVAWKSTVGAIMAAINPSKHLDGKGPRVSRMQRLIELSALSLSSYICYFGNLAVGIVAGVVFQRGLLALYQRFGSRD